MSAPCVFEKRVLNGPIMMPAQGITSGVPATVLALLLVAMLAHSQPRNAAVELDVKNLVFQPKTKVVGIIGHAKSRMGEFDMYAWGMVRYERGLLKAITYNYKRRPGTIQEALQKVGLSGTSASKESKYQGHTMLYGWSSSAPLMGDGLEITGAVLADFSQVNLYFVRRH